jgi:hypothetical protein
MESRCTRGVRGGKSPQAEATLPEWHWYVTVETLEECGGELLVPYRRQTHFLTTEVDPREVDHRDRDRDLVQEFGEFVAPVSSAHVLRHVIQREIVRNALHW